MYKLEYYFLAEGYLFILTCLCLYIYEDTTGIIRLDEVQTTKWANEKEQRSTKHYTDN
jgi:hypothetical protein